MSILLVLELPACGPDAAISASDASGASTTSTATNSSTGSTVPTSPTTGASSEGGSGSASMGTSATSITTASGTTASGTTAAESTTGPAVACTPADCEAPEALKQLFAPDVPSGFERCANGSIHRAEAVACAAPMVAGTCAVAGGGCETDADCQDKPFGACVDNTCGPAPTCGCEYGCETDADCLAGQVCLCGIEGLNDRPRCVNSGCASDADCGGHSCSPSLDATGTFVEQLACHTESDACCSPAECDLGQICAAFGAHWVCLGLSDCGRPLLVEGHAARAPTAPRHDWCSSLAGIEQPAPAQRQGVAAHWARAARAEHASVASFARFILQLIALGAPPALILAAQEALADEVAHAQVCFALASAYGENPLGPGPLPAACAALATDLESAVLAAIDEACVGETLAALEVAEAAAHAADPHLRALLLQIADDEARHAALGWSFVRWALEGADEGLRRRAAERFAAALAWGAANTAAEDRSGDELVDLDGEVLRRFGLLDDATRGDLVRRGLVEVVAPCAAALLAA